MSIIKKIFFVSALILVVCLFFLGIYNLSFKKPEEITQPKTTNATPASPTTPATEIAKISTVSDEAVLSPVLSPDGLSIKYYSKNTGRAYQIDLDGTNKKTLSEKNLVGLSNVLWSPDSTKVISKFILANEIRFGFYDYTDQKGAELNKNIKEVVWDSTGSKILYVYYDPETKKSSLNISNPDGSSWKKLTDLDYSTISIAAVPQSGTVSFWNKPDSFSQTTLESTVLIGGEKKALFKEKFGADYLWNSSGTNVLISHTDAKGGSKMQLATANYNGGEYSNLGIPTFTSKCTWSKNGKTLYYALPGNIPATAVLPNEYTEEKIKTSDTFWKIDMASKQPTRIVELEDLQKINMQFDGTSLFLSQDESFLFFINKLDGKLYKISL